MEYWSFDIDERVAVVNPTLGARKALSLAAASELSELLDRLGDLADTTRLVILNGGDDGQFLGDVDRGEIASSLPFAGDDTRDDVDWYAWHRIGVTLASMPQPSVAATDGAVAGGGYLIALHCTLRIGSERAIFGPAELSLGIVGTESFSRLVRLIGPSLTAELLMTNRVVQADEAKRIGLLNEVVPSDGFIEQVRRWCEPIASVPNLFEIKRAVVGEDFVPRSEFGSETPWKGLREQLFDTSRVSAAISGITNSTIPPR